MASAGDINGDGFDDLIIGAAYRDAASFAGALAEVHGQREEFSRAARAYARRFSWMGPLKLAAGQTTAAALVMLPLAALADRFWALPPPGPGAWGALLGIGLLSTAFAYFLFFRILERAEPTDLMPASTRRTSLSVQSLRGA